MSCPREDGGGKRRNGFNKAKNVFSIMEDRKVGLLERIEKDWKKCLDKILDDMI